MKKTIIALIMSSLIFSGVSFADETKPVRTPQQVLLELKATLYDRDQLNKQVEKLNKEYIKLLQAEQAKQETVDPETKGE